MTVVDCLIALEDDPPKDSKEMMVSIGDLVLYIYQVPQKSPRTVRRIRFEASEDMVLSMDDTGRRDVEFNRNTWTFWDRGSLKRFRQGTLDIL